MEENGRREVLNTNADVMQNAEGCCFASDLSESSRVDILFQLARVTISSPYSQA